MPIGMPANLASFEHPYSPQEIPKIAAAIKTFMKHLDEEGSAAFRDLLRRFLWVIYSRIDSQQRPPKIGWKLGGLDSLRVIAARDYPSFS